MKNILTAVSILAAVLICFVPGLSFAVSTDAVPAAPVPGASQQVRDQIPDEDSPARGSAALTVQPLHESVYQLRISGADLSFASVRVPTWSEAGGQDDLVWYTATAENPGTWTVNIDTARHGGGPMTSHVYADGQCIGIVSYTAPVPDGVSVLAAPKGASLFLLVISNVPPASKVQVPVWSEAYGQEDLIWYDAQYQGGGIWYAGVSASRHAGGNMLCHVYVDGQPAAGTSFSAPVSHPAVHTKLLYGTRYDIVIQNLWGAQKVLVPTWGTAGGQSDLIWYTASKAAPGTWRACLNAASHDEGVISSHVYSGLRCIDSSIFVVRNSLSVRDAAGNPTSAPAVNTLPRSKYGWGHGGPRDASGRPEGAVTYQQRFGRYGADFIGPADNRMYLTFDEGYENGYTSRILDVLKQKQVKAVFFVTYPYVRENPRMVRRMIEEGHQVGNHSTTHPSFPSVSTDRAMNEVMQLHTLMQKEFGYEMTLCRLPSGEFCERDLALLQALGYRSVFWSFAYRDWEVDNQRGAAAALRTASNAIHPGAIYLLHAVSRDNAMMLGDFIDACRSRGYMLSPYGF